ncbi:MAG: sugar phosphate isomerase/epimerase family protein [Gemmatimonadota bacterium]
MKLAISNIAWRREEEPAVLRQMQAHGVTGLEIAPTAVWPDPLSVTDAELLRYRRQWEAEGVSIVALQALLFGHPELIVFGDAGVREKTLVHLRAMMRIAEALGARVLVFGSPKNRLAAGLEARARDRLAHDFFSAAGAAAAAHGVELCIEANPPEYGCDFITRPAEALKLVQETGVPGFGLHLDTGGMTLTGDPAARALDDARGAIRHFHASEPYLAPLGSGAVDHAAFAEGLRRQNYDRWVSVEMRQPPEGSSLPQIKKALEYLREQYGN